MYALIVVYVISHKPHTPPVAVFATRGYEG